MPDGALLDRLADKFLVGDDCWDWTATKQKLGYGLVRVDGKKRLAHRVVYELFVGPIPEGLELDHLCRNRGCVRPDHLEPVTHRENTMRGDTIVARNARKTHCPSGHTYDEANTRLYQNRRYCKACQRGR